MQYGTPYISTTCNSLFLLQKPNLSLQLLELLMWLEKNQGKQTREPQSKTHKQTYNSLLRQYGSLGCWLCHLHQYKKCGLKLKSC